MSALAIAAVIVCGVLGLACPSLGGEVAFGAHFPRAIGFQAVTEKRLTFISENIPIMNVTKNEVRTLPGMKGVKLGLACGSYLGKS